MFEISEAVLRPKGCESNAVKTITLDGELVAIVLGKTENDVENFTKRIAGLLEASVGLHYEVAIKLMVTAKEKWQATEPKPEEPAEPERNPDE